MIERIKHFSSLLDFFREVILQKFERNLQLLFNTYKMCIKNAT